MRRIALAILFVIVGLTACQRTPNDLTLGPYVRYFVDNYPLEASTVRLDQHGIPETFYPNLGWQVNPLTISRWGNAEHARWLTQRKNAQRKAFMTASDWLLDNQRADGAWEYTFPWSNGVTDLPVPWISSIQQGMAVSLLARAYEVTGEDKYLESALRAMKPFTVHVNNGGLVDEYEGIGPTLEEYPAPGGSTFVLNGWMFALIGLHELHGLTGDEEALRIFTESELALRQMLHLYEVVTDDGLPWSTYDLRHLLGGEKHLATNTYMRIQAYQLEYLHHATGYAPYEELKETWEGAARTNGATGLPSDPK